MNVHTVEIVVKFSAYAGMYYAIIRDTDGCILADTDYFYSADAARKEAQLIVNVNAWMVAAN